MCFCECFSTKNLKCTEARGDIAHVAAAAEDGVHDDDDDDGFQ
jgi:hypothetical protein